jgi:hypothetical protein
MNINSDGVEIDAATDMEVYGDWIKFVDGEGATVKIDPSVIRKLYEFAMAHAEEFDEGAWNIDWQPVFATNQISEKVKTLAPISNLQIKAYLERLMGRVARRYQGSQEDRDVAYGMEIVYFDLINLLNGEEV